MSQLDKIKHRKKPLLVIFLVLFVAVASSVVISRAQPKVGVLNRQTGKLLLGYRQEKPTIVTSVNGQPVYASRGKSVEVSTNQTLFCTPEDAGVITFRQLTSAEQTAVSSQVKQSRNVSLPSDVSENATDPHVNSYRSVAVRDGQSFKDSRTYKQSLRSDYQKNTEQLLDSLCANPGTPVPEEGVPTLVSQTTEAKSIAARAKELITPKAYAGGTPTVPSPILDTAAEDVQHIRLATYRKQHGLLATTRNNCLDIWARNWARQMATEKRLYHSNLQTQYINNCGVDDNLRVDWLAFGENIGTVPITVSDDPAVAKDASSRIFDAFIASPAHNSNMLDRRWELHGVGAYKTADKTQIYIVQAFKQSSTYDIPVK